MAQDLHYKKGEHGLVRQSPYVMLPVPDALDIVLREAAAARRQAERVELRHASGLVLAADARATMALPPFPASIMDGYAVVASDMPGTFPVVGEVKAGRVADFEVSAGCVARITTGAPVPAGADAVIKVEVTELLEERDAQGRQLVKFNVGTAPGRCIRPVGSDIQPDQIVVTASTAIGAAESGLLATVGVKEVLVHPAPRIAVLSTGDELVAADKEPGPGQIRDSNKSMLMSALHQYSSGRWEAIDLGIASDDPADLRAKVQQGLNEADVLLTSGGVSMGELDLLQPLLEELGTVHFGRVLMKPGKPLTFATVLVAVPGGGTKTVLVFALPGNPVSSLVTFQLFALPALRSLSGNPRPHLRHVTAKLAFDAPLDPERPEYHRVKLEWDDHENCWVAHSTGNQSADALLCLPQAEGTLSAGTFAKALLIAHLNGRGKMEPPAGGDGEKGRIFFGSLERQGQQLVQQQAKEPEAAPVELETLPFSHNIAESQERHSALLEQLELSKRARQIAVPTSDPMVRARLRELGEPITLFGEQPPERRERLREVLSRVEVTQAVPATTAPAPLVPTNNAAATKKRTDKMQEQPYFTEGSADLKASRRLIADYSLLRAQQRVERAKRKREDGNFEEELRKAATSRDCLRRFSNAASQIGDDRPLSYCAFSPDSSILATASWSGQSKLWSVPSCDLKTTLKGHGDRVGAIVFHPRSCIGQEPGALNLASCSSDRTIKLWSLDSSNPIGSLEGHTDRVSRLAFHPSGRFIGTTGFDKTWRLWDVEKGQELLVQEGHSREVYGIAFQCDGSLAATSGMDGYGRVWDLRTGRSVMLLKGHAKSVLGIDFALNGYQLATGSDDHTVKIWDLRKKRCSYTIPAHSALISHVKFQPSEEGQFLLTASFDSTCRLWSTRDFSPITTLAGHEGKVLCADISPDRRYIASSSFDRTWKLFAEDLAFF